MPTNNKLILSQEEALSPTNKSKKIFSKKASSGAFEAHDYTHNISNPYHGFKTESIIIKAKKWAERKCASLRMKKGNELIEQNWEDESKPKLNNLAVAINNSKSPLKKDYIGSKVNAKVEENRFPGNNRNNISNKIIFNKDKLIKDSTIVEDDSEAVHSISKMLKANNEETNVLSNNQTTSLIIQTADADNNSPEANRSKEEKSDILANYPTKAYVEEIENNVDQLLSLNKNNDEEKAFNNKIENVDNNNEPAYINELQVSSTPSAFKFSHLVSLENIATFLAKEERYVMLHLCKKVRFKVKSKIFQQTIDSFENIKSVYKNKLESLKEVNFNFN